jgi:hypothetical protein
MWMSIPFASFFPVLRLFDGTARRSSPQQASCHQVLTRAGLACISGSLRVLCESRYRHHTTRSPPNVRHRTGYATFAISLTDPSTGRRRCMASPGRRESTRSTSQRYSGASTAARSANTFGAEDPTPREPSWPIRTCRCRASRSRSVRRPEPLHPHLQAVHRHEPGSVSHLSHVQDTVTTGG